VKAAVRLAVPDDLAFIQQKCHFAEKEVLRKFGENQIFLLTVDDNPAGYLSIGYLWSTVPYIDMLWISEAYQKKGFSRPLLGFVEDYLKERGHSTLYSSSTADEEEPQAWHRHMGFVECGVISGLNDGGIGEIFFRKRL
jgi:predicted GNAT superfamily acetyltransferase